MRLMMSVTMVVTSARFTVLADRWGREAHCLVLCVVVLLWASAA